MSTRKTTITSSKNDDVIVKALARMLLPRIVDFYNSDEGQQTFKKWESEMQKGDEKIKKEE